MTEPKDAEPGPKWAERNFTAPFHRTVLARYKCSLDLYEIDEDDCGGKLRRRSDVEDPDVPTGQPQYFELRYGFRHLADGRICVVAWLPDWDRLPQREQNAWATDLIIDAAFAEQDATYQRWCDRILEGKWNDAGPLEELSHQLHRVRAITSVGLGQPLFEASDSPLMHYPIAENSAELLASVTELHRVVIDGLSPAPLRQLATILRVSVADGSGTLSTLKQVLPEQLVAKIHKPFAALRSERNALHRVPAPKPQSMAAFDRFSDIARGAAAAVSELRSWLVEQLPVDEDDCVRRLEIMESRLLERVEPLGFRHADTDKLESVKGKTVERVQIGKAGLDLKYGRDAIALHFTDGSTLVVSPVANVGNWEDRVSGFDRGELNVRLDIDFIPSGARPAELPGAGQPADKPQAP